MSLLLQLLQWLKKRRLQAALVALGLAVGTVALWRSNAFWNALSPVTHKEVLYRLAGRTKVDPLLLAAIVRTESSFNPFAESGKGAMGLMQLMPATAEQMAHQLKLNYQDQDDLYTQDINLTLGAFYFAQQLKAFDGNLVLGLAAYNAGPAKVRSWKLDPWGKEQEELITAIPLSATRKYIRNVLWHYRFYQKLQTVKRYLNGDPTL